MVVRIYSLAKELKLDSKVLVDICTKAGVGGKGSALASLTDEEVAKVKAFFRAAKDEKRPWKKVFGHNLPELEAEWLQSLEAPGRVSAEWADFLEGIWKENPKTACDRAEEAAAKK